MREPFRPEDGISGDKGFVSVKAADLVLHAYFEREVIRFECYWDLGGSPRPPRPPGLAGEADAGTIKDAIRLVSQGKRPDGLLLERARGVERLGPE